MNEALDIMSRPWTEEEVTFSGRFFQYDRASIMPRPGRLDYRCGSAAVLTRP
ncbi:MAG: hypothetical protein CM1200mP20_00950 [Pseudomonadota bacterium]|nr:MAG: hypothetical protein CM1200mP20_00950 [Pseudomonadota bacterium]